MTGFETSGTVSTDRFHDGVALLTIANESARNALDDVTRRQLLEALQAANSDDSVRAIVLHGEGLHFCAGGELKSMPRDPQSITIRLGEMQSIARLIVAGSAPVICAVEGFAFGSGMSLASAAAFVVAGESASFGCSFGRVGLIPDTGLLWTLAQKVGHHRVGVLSRFSRAIDSSDAHAFGLVDEVVADGAAVDRALELARELAESAPLALRAIQRILHDEVAFEAVLQKEMTTQIELLGTSDFEEGRSAFFGRSAPVFTGK